jgi:hypothetical protein
MLGCQGSVPGREQNGSNSLGLITPANTMSLVGCII